VFNTQSTATNSHLFHFISANSLKTLETLNLLFFSHPSHQINHSKPLKFQF